MRKLLVGIMALGISLLVFVFARPIYAQQTNELIITQVKVGGDEVSGYPKEYVTLQNTYSSELALGGIVLEYYKTPSQLTEIDCSQYPWQLDSGDDYIQVELPDQTLSPGEQLVMVVGNMPDARGGSIRLVGTVGEDNVMVYDLVGWSVGGSAALCSETKPISMTSSKVITRTLDYSSQPIDTDDNSQDFTNQPAPSIDLCINISGLQADIPAGYIQDSETGVCTLSQEDESSCEGVILSEVLPNPAGADVGKEFIELHNPTDKEISLIGCSLRTSASNREYNFEDEVLSGGEYRSFGDTLTGLSLQNGNGGTVWLLSISEEIDKVDYPENMKDDVSYAKIQDVWRQTYQPTPDKKNIMLAELPCPSGQQRNSESGRCRNIITAATSADCGPGRYRNPETNRCRNIATATGVLKPCAADQYRNPETNRCRSLASAGSSLKPCAADQFRNPETNRCKKLESAESSLKPCSPGQERNPETNRCRKIIDPLTAVTDPAQISPSETKPLGFDYRVWGMLGAATVGYGVYEYRSELSQWLSRLRSRRKKMKPPG